MSHCNEVRNHAWLKELLLDMHVYAIENDLNDTGYLLQRTICALSNESFSSSRIGKNVIPNRSDLSTPVDLYALFKMDNLK